ncbi:restriction endonuclease subunit S [Streptomyces anulatus]
MKDLSFLGPAGEALRSLPEGWETKPLWSMFERIKDIEHPDEQMLSVFRDYGVVPKSSRENLNQTAENRDIYQLVHPGWLVVNRMKAWQGSVGISDYRGIVSGHYICFAPRHDADAKYLNYLLRSDPYTNLYKGLSRGVRPGQIEIDNDQLRKLPIIVAPLVEQRAIADYLDCEVAEMDALIGAQQRFIGHLQRRRAALIERALLDVEAAEPGLRLKHVTVSVRQGWSPQCYPWPADGIETWAVLKAGAANRGLFRPDENKELPEELDPRPETVVRGGDLVISRANTRELVGSAAAVMGSYPRLMLSDKLYALRLNDSKALPRYVALVLASRKIRDFIEMQASGASSSMLNISREDIGNLPMDLPTVSDQQRILVYVDEHTARVDLLIAKAQENVELMKKRKAALTTAVVTGHKRVPVAGQGAA